MMMVHCASQGSHMPIYETNVGTLLKVSMAQLLYWKFEWGVKHWVSSSRWTLWPIYLDIGDVCLTIQPLLSHSILPKKWFISAKGHHIPFNPSFRPFWTAGCISLAPYTYRSDNVKCLPRLAYEYFTCNGSSSSRNSKTNKDTNYNNNNKMETKREENVNKLCHS